MKILVTGGAGYVGSELSKTLASIGHDVIAFDVGWFGFPAKVAGVTHVAADIRDGDALKSSMKGVEAVFHLACISNDPSYELDPSLSESINGAALEGVFRTASESGVRRLIYASSSSVYGIKEEESVNEVLVPEPLTQYSALKQFGEELLLSLNLGEMERIVARPATVYGVSDRQRFDLVVNLLTHSAWTRRELKVLGGSQFRPNIALKDLVEAYVLLLEAPAKEVDGEIFNIGSENLTVDQIARIVASKMPFQVKTSVEPSNDLRSYRIDSTKFAERVGFVPRLTVEDGVEELVSAFQNGLFGDLQEDRYFNVRQMLSLSQA